MNKQKIPDKPKKKNKIRSEDKEKFNKFYQELNDFYEVNQKVFLEKENKSKYECQFDEKQNLFQLNNYDYNLFDSFGVIKDKKLYINYCEMIYLRQIGVIKCNELVESKYKNKNYEMLYLYSYLRRNGKIFYCCSHLNKKAEHFLISYDDTENFKNKNIDSIICLHSTKSISFREIEIIIAKSKEIIEKLKPKNSLEPNIVVAFCEGINITFIKINNNILNNID